MGLGVEPADLTSLEGDVTTLTTPTDQPSLKAAQRVHEAVRVLVRARFLTGLITVFQDSHKVVLEDDLVLVGIGRRWISHTLLLASGRSGTRATTADTAQSRTSNAGGSAKKRSRRSRGTISSCPNVRECPQRPTR